MKWALWCCQCFQGPEKTRSVSPFDSSWRPLFGPFRPLQPLKPFELDHTKSHHCRLSQHTKRQSGKVTSQAIHSHLVHTSKPNVFRKHMKAWQMSFPGGLADFGPSAAADAMWMWYPSGPGILIKHVQTCSNMFKRVQTCSNMFKYVIRPTSISQVRQGPAERKLPKEWVDWSIDRCAYFANGSKGVD